MEEISKSGFG
jgi:integrin alpha FG-GAP repeat containing protein 1